MNSLEKQSDPEEERDIRKALQVKESLSSVGGLNSNREISKQQSYGRKKKRRK